MQLSGMKRTDLAKNTISSFFVNFCKLGSISRKYAIRRQNCEKAFQFQLGRGYILAKPDACPPVTSLKAQLGNYGFDEGLNITSCKFHP